MHDSEARQLGCLVPVGEPRHSAACDDCLGEMIRSGRMSVAGIASDAQGHGGHHDAVSAQPAYRLLQAIARILAHVDDQAGVGRHFR